MNPLFMSKHILLGITGGIAAYKSCELVRLLKKQGHSVSVVMTDSATEFVSPLTFQALTGNPVLSYTYSGASNNGMAHINLTRKADAFLIAPATANTIAKIANGLADNLLTTLAAARKCPLAVAPAMNVEMWNNPANLRNIEQLASDGITNISSGQMGMALARACRAAGAKVTLIYGQIQTALPAGLAHPEQAVSAEAMYQAVHRHIHEQDVFISVAAVADYKVKNSSNEKLKKNGNQPPVIELTENPDILASVATLPSPPFCVGFAAESHQVLEFARAKRLRKNVPMLVANQVSVSMGKPTNQITIIDDLAETSFPETSKRQAADEIVKRLAELLA